jgi:hypothetical protein
VIHIKKRVSSIGKCNGSIEPVGGCKCTGGWGLRETRRKSIRTWMGEGMMWRRWKEVMEYMRVKWGCDCPVKGHRGTRGNANSGCEWPWKEPQCSSCVSLPGALFILYGTEWQVSVAAQNKAVLHVHASGMEGNLIHFLMTLSVIRIWCSGVRCTAP